MSLKEKISTYFDPSVFINIRRIISLKSISIKVDKKYIDIKVPFLLNNKSIEYFIHKKINWIQKQIDIQTKIKSFKEKKYIDGEKFLYLGKIYRLKIIINNQYSIYIEDSLIIINVKNHYNLSKIRKIIKKWLYERSFDYFNEQTYMIAKKNNLNINSIKIRDYRARWGSCSVKGDISFNWRLIMAPPEIIEYVIVHELMHLKEHNHSPEYWRLVKSLYPDIDKAKNWLMYNGQTLNI